MIYRTEHPKPQFERPDWLTLNGEWEFEFDYSVSGEARNLNAPCAVYGEKINVPFCPESKLSGIEKKDFVNSVWYKRTIDITEEQLKERVFLHFGAVDYFATIYINGKKCSTHKGGYVSFSIDITDYLSAGTNTVTLNAKDDTRSGAIPTGKQSARFESYGCHYTRTTGIWQSVWLEFVPKNYIKSVKYYTDPNNMTLTICADLHGEGEFSATAIYEGKEVGSDSVYSDSSKAVLTLKLSEKHLWEVGNGRLYDLELKFGDDFVKSYFGLRSIEYKDYKFLINGKSVFQRLVLDQGFYPDGIYTAPSDDELKADVTRSMDMGFNGARLHEKVFEERFLYHCDKAGYIVWGEYPNWGLDHSQPESVYGMLGEWTEELERDFNHPSIVGWCPFNETWDIDGRKQYDELLSLVYKVTKSIDNTRPCIDTSGNFHVVTDIYDLHDYEQNVEIFREHYAHMWTENKLDFHSAFNARQHYDYKKPFFVSEYGGIAWSENEQGWGYGNAPKTKKEFLERLKGLTNALLDDEKMFGFCYTQLTDVEQEQNGLYYYDRRPKFEKEEIFPIFSKKAAIED